MSGPWEQYQSQSQQSGPWDRYRGSVNEPTSTANAVAARNDLVPQPQQSRYNPNQSTFGYVANEAGKNVLGLLGLPESAVNAAAGSATPIGPIASLATAFRDAAGLPTISRIAGILGIDPKMKAPGPGTEIATGAGLDVAQNFLFPGGSAAQKVAGGIGSFVGRKIGEDAGAPGEFIGSVVGGVAAPALIASRVSALKSAASLLGNNAQELGAKIRSDPQFMSKLRTSVINELSESLRQDPDGYAAKFAAAQDLEKSLPGLKLNLGQMFEAPSVLQKQRALEASSPVEMNAAQARRNANESVLRGALGEQPTARNAAAGALDDLAGAAGVRSRGIAADIARTADEAKAISARVSQADLPTLGQKALDIRVSELGKARAKANSLMDLASQAAKQEGAAFDTASLVAKARQIQSEPIWDDANTTAIFGKVKALSGDGGFDWNPIEGATPRNASKTIGFDDIKEMRQAVNADIAAALRSNSPNARAQLRNLSVLKNEIDSVIENSPFAATKKAYGEFVDFYKNEFAPRFLRGANLLAEKTTSLGESRLPPERVFSTYLKPNGGVEMGRYVKLYGENAEAMSTMRDAVLDRYAREVVRDGVIDPAQHAKFVERYKVPLGVLDKAGFKFAGELSDVAKASESVQGRLVALQDAAQRADKDLARGIITDQFGTKTPEQVVAEILPDPRKTNLLLSRMNKDQARGLVEFMKDDLVRQFSKDGVINPEAIDLFLADRMKSQSYRNALAKVYSTDVADQQIKTLGQIAEAARRLDSTPVPKSAAVEGKPSLFHDDLQKKTGLSIAVIGNMARAVVAGRVSPEWAALALGSQAGATMMQNMKNEIYKEVLRDPQSAQMLLQVMRHPPETGKGLQAIAQFARRVPSFVNYLTGFNKYPEFAKYAIANFGREQSEPQ